MTKFRISYYALYYHTYECTLERIRDWHHGPPCRTPPARSRSMHFQQSIALQHIKIRIFFQMHIRRRRRALGMLYTTTTTTHAHERRRRRCAPKIERTHTHIYKQTNIAVHKKKREAIRMHGVTTASWWWWWWQWTEWRMPLVPCIKCICMWAHARACARNVYYGRPPLSYTAAVLCTAFYLAIIAVCVSIPGNSIQIDSSICQVDSGYYG